MKLIGLINPTLVFLLFLSCFICGCTNRTTNDSVTPWEESRNIVRSDYVDEEDTVTVFSHEFNENFTLTEFTVTMTWMDEPDMQVGLRTYENSAEHFVVWIVSDSITQTADGFNSHGEEGQIIVEYPFHYHEQHNNTRRGPFSMEVLVELSLSGDYHYYLWIDPLVEPDTGNDFYCEISFTGLTTEKLEEMV